MTVSLDELIDVLGIGPQRPLARSLAGRLDPAAPADWRRLAAALALRDPVAVVGISGGQGAGKSTLARLLVTALELTGRRAVSCSIDDFYLSRASRRTLAARVHPLLATRGVPGTHDVELALATLRGLGSERTTLVPVFDKGSDDLLPRDRWRTVAGPVGVVFEGWCLGAVPEPDARLEIPLNALEAEEDADGRWRRHVNDALAAAYQTLWDRVDYLLYLQVPDFAAVGRWRAQQERQLPPEQRMDGPGLTRFLSHYERVTLWMLETLPARADLVVKLDADHTAASVHRGGAR